MKEQFITKTFHDSTMEVINKAISIIEAYDAQGYTLTLRQLYYQFIQRNWFPENTERMYKRLGNIISDARKVGMIDWDSIEDRNRNLKSWVIEEDTQAALFGLEHNIGFDFWERQGVYVEVWVEKEALANVIGRACCARRVPYLACKGYLSSSESYDAGKRFERMRDAGIPGVLIHLGDHDPSGIDMTRDNTDRIEMYSWQSEVEVRRIALNYDQVKEHRPPPNPAKLKDSRAKQYIKRFGKNSWELDALDPKTLHSLIRDEVDSLIDPDVWDKTERQEQEARQTLIALRQNWSKIEKHIIKKYIEVKD